MQAAENMGGGSGEERSGKGLPGQGGSSISENEVHSGCLCRFPCLWISIRRPGEFYFHAYDHLQMTCFLKRYDCHSYIDSKTLLKYLL